MIDRAIVEREESARRTAPSLRQAIRRPPPGPGAAALRLPDHVREAARDASDSRLQVAGARREASREPSLARGVRGRKRHATGPAIEPSSVRTGPGSFASTTTLLSRPTGRALLGCLARLHYWKRLQLAAWTRGTWPGQLPGAHRDHHALRFVPAHSAPAGQRPCQRLLRQRSL